MKTLIGKLTLIALTAVLALAPTADAAFTSGTLRLASPTGISKTKSTRIFTYTTSDALATVEASNYFQSSALAAKDVIYVGASDGKVFLSLTAATATTSTTAVMAASSPIWVCTNGAAYGTPGAVAYSVAPIAGTVTKAYHVVTTPTNADVALNLDGGGSNMTGTLTITNADAAGTIDVATISASNTVTAGEAIAVESDGAGTAGAGTTCFQITP